MKRLLLISVLASLSSRRLWRGRSTANQGPTASQALTGTAEWLEFEAPPYAQPSCSASRPKPSRSSRPARPGPVLFPMVHDGEFVAGPALDPQARPAPAPDAGARSAGSPSTAAATSSSDDRRDAFQGLSEREAAELIARSLLQHWGVQPTGPVVVDARHRSAVRRRLGGRHPALNPSFVYHGLRRRAVAPSTPTRRRPGLERVEARPWTRHPRRPAPPHAEGHRLSRRSARSTRARCATRTARAIGWC